MRLTRVAGVGARLSYTYDFGDDWDLLIEVEKKVPAADDVSYPRCTGGRRAAPVEDCGGIGGWEYLLELRKKPDDALGEYELEQVSMLPEDFDPAVFNVAEVNAALEAPDEDEQTEDDRTEDEVAKA